MSLLNTFALLTALALVARLLTRWSWRPRRLAWIVSLSLVIGICGAWLITTDIHEIRSEFARRDWPTVDGVVVESKIAGDRAFHPQIVYSYTVGDTVYFDTTDLGHPGFGASRSRLQSAEMIVESYHPGLATLVHYDPANPQNSKLRPGPEWFSFVRMSFGGFLYLGAVFLLALILMPAVLRRGVQ